MAEIVKDDDFWKGFVIGQALKPILWRAKGAQYDVVFEGFAEVTECVTNELGTAYRVPDNTPIAEVEELFTTNRWLEKECTYRVTLNGVRYDTVCMPHFSGGTDFLFLGNRYLRAIGTNNDYGDPFDEGYDFCIEDAYILVGCRLYFYARTPGTYHIKVEKLVTT